MRVLAEIGVGGVDGQRCVTLARLVSHTDLDEANYRVYYPLAQAVPSLAARSRCQPLPMLGSAGFSPRKFVMGPHTRAPESMHTVTAALERQIELPEQILIPSRHLGAENRRYQSSAAAWPLGCPPLTRGSTTAAPPLRPAEHRNPCGTCLRTTASRCGDAR